MRINAAEAETLPFARNEVGDKPRRRFQPVKKTNLYLDREAFFHLVLTCRLAAGRVVGIGMLPWQRHELKQVAEDFAHVPYGAAMPPGKWDMIVGILLDDLRPFSNVLRPGGMVITHGFEPTKTAGFWVEAEKAGSQFYYRCWRK